MQSKCNTTIVIISCTSDIESVGPTLNDHSYNDVWAENQLPNDERIRYVLCHRVAIAKICFWFAINIRRNLCF